MLTLLPQPRQLDRKDGTFTLPDSGFLVLDVLRPDMLLFTARRAQQALADFAGSHLHMTAGSAAVRAVLRLTLNPALRQAEAYRLTVNADGIEIVGKDAPGLFYGVCTLIQLVQTQGRTLPQLMIADYPDFPARGVMLDISRDKVPTMETLYALVDRLAGWKINQLQLYMEHTFAYHAHERVWKNASPLTAEEILALDAYCRERFIELVPNQNSFGHMHRWLEHPEYVHLGETETGIMMPWGEPFPHPYSLSPAVPESLPFLESLYDELLPNFSSRLFNVGADETFDLGQGRSKAMVEAQGKGRVYLDYLLQIYQRVKARQRTMQFWGDIINQYPDLVPLLPRDTIALEWGYEADHDFPGKTKLFAEAGIPYYVCPGTSTWNTIAGRTDNCIGNIRNAVENGLNNGAVGVLNTDWGDNGHWQTFPVSYLGFAYGAAVSWCYAANRDLDLPAVLDAFAFEDSAGVMGKLAYDLGNAYQQPGILVFNGSLLFSLYNRTLRDAEIAQADQLKAALHQTITYVNQALEPLDLAAMRGADASLIEQEFRLAASMLTHAARRGLFMLHDPEMDTTLLRSELDAIIEEYSKIWLARNREGGLSDSLARLEKARALFD